VEGLRVSGITVTVSYDAVTEVRWVVYPLPHGETISDHAKRVYGTLVQHVKQADTVVVFPTVRIIDIQYTGRQVAKDG
jgi:hypothetical protein